MDCKGFGKTMLIGDWQKGAYRQIVLYRLIVKANKALVLTDDAFIPVGA